MARSNARYRVSYLDYLIKEEGFPRKRYKREINDFVAGHVARLPAGSRVLDVGCGAGRILSALRDDVRKCGVDTDIEAVIYTRARVRAGWYALADARQLPFADETFDAVISSMVIEHEPDEKPLLAEMARVLRPEGIALVVTPNYGSFVWRLVERVWFWLVGYRKTGIPLSEFHCNRFSKERLEGALGRHFTVVSLDEITFGMTLAAVGVKQ